MSSSFQRIAFALLLRILWGFCTTVTHASCPASRSTLPEPPATPGLEAPLSGLQQCFCLVLSVGMPKMLLWSKSAHPAFLPGAFTPLPPLGASSSPAGSLSYCRSHHDALMDLYRPRSSSTKQHMPPAAYSSAILTTVHPESGCRVWRAQEGLQESLDCFPDKLFYHESPRLINSPKYQVRHRGASPPGKQDFGSL